MTVTIKEGPLSDAKHRERVVMLDRMKKYGSIEQPTPYTYSESDLVREFDSVMTPVTYRSRNDASSDLADVLLEMRPCEGPAKAKAALVARYRFDDRYERGRVETSRVFPYGGSDFVACVVKTKPGRKPKAGEQDTRIWKWTVFLREHVGNEVRTLRDGQKRSYWLWEYHNFQTFLSVGQAYDLYERLCSGMRTEAQLDASYGEGFTPGMDMPWDPQALAEMVDQPPASTDVEATGDWAAVDTPPE